VGSMRPSSWGESKAHSAQLPRYPVWWSSTCSKLHLFSPRQIVKVGAKAPLLIRNTGFSSATDIYKYIQNKELADWSQFRLFQRHSANNKCIHYMKIGRNSAHSIPTKFARDS
jgi:hypothetical protein